MPLIKSLYEPIDVEKQNDGSISVPLGKLAMLIAGEIISEKPHLVIGAHADQNKRKIIQREIVKIMDRDSYYHSGGRQSMISGIFDFMFGYGVLQKFIDDDDISDIDGTAYDEFSITKNGKRIAVDVNFGDSQSFGVYCRLMAVRNGGFLNEDNTHCRVADLSRRLRINVSIPPRNVSGPAISIRKHKKKAYTTQQLKQLGMINDNIVDILSNAAQKGKSVLFCGKGAAGKTTILRTFLNWIPEMERVLVVESDAEIYPEKKFCIEQRTKKDGEGGRPVTLEMLIKDGLTMSLDTYCVGEIVGGEAYPFIQASCTGHRVLGTVHSDSAQDALSRIVSLSLRNSQGESVETMMHYAARGIDMVVYLNDFKVENICEIKVSESGKQIQHAVYNRSLQ